MSVYSEQRRLMAEFENREKRPRGARSGDHDENGALEEHSRFVDAQKNRSEESRELRGRPSVEIRRRSSNPAEGAGSRARERSVSDDSASIDAASARARRPQATVETSRSARASGSRNRDAWSEPQESEPQEQASTYRAVDIGYGRAARRRLLYFTALLIVIGVFGLTASSVSWRKLLNPAEIALIEREGRGAKLQPEKMAGAQPTQEPADDEHYDLGHVLAPFETAALRPKLLFDQAPPLMEDSIPEPSKAADQAEKAGDVEKASDVEKVSKVEKDTKSKANESIANCFVKVDGRVLISRSCQVSWTKQQQVAFKIAEKSLTISYDHGRTWLATLGSQELGKVYKTGSCWGSKRVYVCEHGK